MAIIQERRDNAQQPEVVVSEHGATEVKVTAEVPEEAVKAAVEAIAEAGPTVVKEAVAEPAIEAPVDATEEIVTKKPVRGRRKSKR